MIHNNHARVWKGWIGYYLFSDGDLSCCEAISMFNGKINLWSGYQKREMGHPIGIWKVKLKKND